MKHLFTTGPMVSIRSSRKISSYLFKAKLHPVEKSGGKDHVQLKSQLRKTTLPNLCIF